jgi:hypothetical protein
MRLCVGAIDVVALIGGLTITFGLRAALRHPELLAYRSMSRFVVGSLVYALPLLLLAFYASGLYSSSWSRLGRAAVVVAVGWASVSTLFVAAWVGPDDAPLATAVPAFVVLCVTLVLGRELARRELMGRGAASPDVP